MLLAFLTTQVSSPVEIANFGLDGFQSTSGASTNAQLEQVLLIVAGMAVWLMVGWTALVLGTAVVATTAPQSIARRAGRVLARCTPRVARQVIFTAVGIGALTGMTACASGVNAGDTTPGTNPASISTYQTSTASTGSAVATPSAAEDETVPDVTTDWDLDWPGPPGSSKETPDPASTQPMATASAVIPNPGAPASTQPAGEPTSQPTPETLDFDWPAGSDAPDPENPSATSAAPADIPPDAEKVTVQAGDTLWSIAKAHLPTDASLVEIDTAWRSWYFINQDAIGDDPDHILVGSIFTMPPP